MNMMNMNMNDFLYRTGDEDWFVDKTVPRRLRNLNIVWIVYVSIDRVLRVELLFT